MAPARRRHAGSARLRPGDDRGPAGTRPTVADPRDLAGHSAVADGAAVLHGQIKLGQWRSFSATQVLAPPRGYIWATTARVAGLPVTGYDRLSSGTGQMRWRLLRLIPVMTAAGPDITRSAYGRLAGEITLLPGAFQATWAQGKRSDTAIATWQFGDDTETTERACAMTASSRSLWSADRATPEGPPSAAAPSGCPSRRRRTSAASSCRRYSAPDGGGAPTGRRKVSSSGPGSQTPSSYSAKSVQQQSAAVAPLSNGH